MAFRSWSESDLREAVRGTGSIRQVLLRLGLRPAGGNYVQVQAEIERLNLDITHFHGKGWRTGISTPTVPARSLALLLQAKTAVQSFKLKRRLFKEGLKEPRCEQCGWCEKSQDGRIPVELDHINGDRSDNRLSNLRVLCPNCHSLQPTHRGRNKLGWRNGRRRTLKMS